jgi:hypothetical protein
LRKPQESAKGNHAAQLKALGSRQPPGVGFAQAHRADLGMGEGGPWNRAVDARTGVAKDAVHCHGALGGGAIGQDHRSGHAAHSPQLGNGRLARQHLELIVHGDEAVLGLHPYRRRVEGGAAGHSAGGHQHRVHLPGSLVRLVRIVATSRLA